MAQEGVPRQGACYMQIIQALAVQGRHADAVEIMELLRAERLQPSQSAATLACLQAVQGAQPAEDSALSEPARRLLQLLHEEWTVHANEPRRLEPSQPFGAITTAPSSPPPPSTPRKTAPAPY